jgi:hypothetical protein
MKDKAKDMLGDHKDQAEQGMDKGRDMASEKTGGKYDDKLDSAADKGKDYLGNMGDDH